MAEHISGKLYYERMGRNGPVMAFIHPNPMDQSCWIFQMAHFSTWYRCIAIDIPGYGRSPSAEKGLTVDDMAQACWEAIDDAYRDENIILVGCSVGSSIAPYMHHLRPDKTKALILCGTGYQPDREFSTRRIKQYTEGGIDFRRDHTFQILSPAFRTTPIAHWFANLFQERNDFYDLQSILYQFEALGAPDAPDHFKKIACPMIILTGSEDNTHKSSFELKQRVKGCELKVLPGAGHACQIEQPWLFDRLMIEFLTKHNLFPRSPKPSLTF